jgi:hypothetical protein
VVDAAGFDERAEEPEVFDLSLAPAAVGRPEAVEEPDQVAGFASRPAACLETPHHRPGGLGPAVLTALRLHARTGTGGPAAGTSGG